MTMRRMRRPARGFTLVELMLVVMIIGLLASMAIPQYTRSTLRARASERITILESTARAVNDLIVNAGAVPGNTFAGVDDPPGTPGAMKRPWDYTIAGWKELPMVVQGGTYYSYNFSATDADGTGKVVNLWVNATGDLDADTHFSSKMMHYMAVGYSFQLIDEDPVRGAEDADTF